MTCSTLATACTNFIGNIFRFRSTSENWVGMTSYHIVDGDGGPITTKPENTNEYIPTHISNQILQSIISNPIPSVMTSTSNQHSDLCWLSDSKLLLLCTLISCDKWGRANTSLKHFLFDLVSPLLCGSTIRLNRVEVVNDLRFQGVIEEVEFNKACVFVLHINIKGHPVTYALHEVVQMWLREYNIMMGITSDIITPSPFLDACVLIPTELDVSSTPSTPSTPPVSHWISLRDLLPFNVRCGSATCIYWWLTQLVPVVRLQLQTDQQIQSFISKTFTAACTLENAASYAVPEHLVKQQLKTTFEMATVWRKQDVSCIFLYCCCNSLGKRTCHKVWSPETIRTLYNSQCSAQCQTTSLTLRPAIINIPIINWQPILEKQEKLFQKKKATISSRKRRKTSVGGSILCDDDVGDSEDDDHVESTVERALINRFQGQVLDALQSEGTVHALQLALVPLRVPQCVASLPQGVTSVPQVSPPSVDVKHSCSLAPINVYACEPIDTDQDITISLQQQVESLLDVEYMQVKDVIQGVCLELVQIDVRLGSTVQQHREQSPDAHFVTFIDVDRHTYC